MPRYFLNLTDGNRTVEDPDGVELAGDAAAREEAAALARDLITHQEGEWAGWSIAITDERGRRIGSGPDHQDPGQILTAPPAGHHRGAFPEQIWPEGGTFA